VRKEFRLAILVAILVLLVLNSIGLVYLNNKRIADEQYRFAVSGALNEFIQHQTTVNDAQTKVNITQSGFNNAQCEFNFAQVSFDNALSH
jgi:uncharacterized membrane protein